MDQTRWQIQVRDRVVVRPGDGIVRVAAPRGIGDGPHALLLNGGIGEGFAVAVLAVPDLLGSAVLEPDHVVLPISNVIAEFLEEHRVAEVVGIEIHVEDVHQSGSMVVDNDRGAGCAVGLPGRVWNNPV